MSVRPPSWRLSGLTVRELFLRVWTAAQTDEVVHRAAALSYASLFSCFPLLLFVVALVSLVPVHHVIRQLMDSLAQVLPDEAASAIRGTLRQVIANGGRRGLISLGAVSALWAGSTGMATVMSMLNVVYRVHDERPWWMRRAIAMALTVLLAAFLIAATLLIMLGERVAVALGIASGVLTTLVPVVLVLFGVDVVYYIAPAGPRHWRWLTPGSVTFTGLWLAMSFGLRTYVANFATYDVTYGAIGGVILLLLWLFLTSIVLLIGAEVNKVIAEAAAEPPVVPAVPESRGAQADRIRRSA
jgi:membrane protein